MPRIKERSARYQVPRESARSGLGARILAVADLYPDRQTAATAAGVSTDQLFKYIREDNKPAFATVARLALAKGVSLEWLATGEGAMSAEERAAGSDCDLVPLPRMAIRRGTGRRAVLQETEQVGTLGFRRDWLRQRRLAPEHLAIADVVGDAMQPVLSHGDWVVYDRADVEIRSGRVYVLAVGGELLVRYLQKMPDGAVQVVSENAAIAPPYVVAPAGVPSQLEVMGRVRADSHEWL